MAKHPGTFRVECCDRRRGLMPGGVLVCSRCDHDHVSASAMPNEGQARDVPEGLRVWRVPPVGGWGASAR